MPRRRATKRPPTLLEQEQQEQRLFESVSRFFGVPITHVRQVRYRWHTGQNLTVSYHWEVLEGDTWREREYCEPAGATGPYEYPT